jgi:FkbM family methyltransferase
MPPRCDCGTSTNEESIFRNPSVSNIEGRNSWVNSKNALPQEGAPVPSLKLYVQDVLKRTGLYQRVKTSRAYDLYWSVADPSIIERVQRELHFYRGLLTGFGRGSLIFDVGANHGTKTDIFLKLGARVVAVEPDQMNQEVLRQKFLTYRLSRKPVVIVGKALSDKEAVETMWIDEPGSAKNTLSKKWVETLKQDDERFGQHHDFAQQTTVETTTLDQLIAIHGLPFFIKIDVEGHEPSVLRGLHSAVPFLSFEVNLPEFAPEGQECVEILGRLAPDGEFNYAPGDYQQGLKLAKWLSAPQFAVVLAACAEKSIEVFWKSPLSSRLI